MVVATPSDEEELRNMMYTALHSNQPFAIRYPRGEGRGVEWRDRPFEELAIGKARTVKEGNKVALFAFGPLLTEVDRGVARYEAEQGEGGVGIYDMRYAKPLDEALVLEVAQRVERVITIEDGVIRGGVGEAVVKLLCDHGITTPVTTLGIGDTFVEHGTVEELRSLCGIDAEAVYDALQEGDTNN
jgi:1-deoxy-D-xylulose-5-phosphate synthase